MKGTYFVESSFGAVLAELDEDEDFDFFLLSSLECDESSLLFFSTLKKN